jgi:pimeloyl-ACP methyl ester carboxylesterase
VPLKAVHRIAVAGRSLEYQRIAATRPGRPDLVFLHEGLGSVTLWRDVPQALALRTGCGALIYSRYGNGFSEPLRERRDTRYMHDEALNVLPELLDALSIDRPVLIGHSDGASIALIYAGEHPAAVRALLLEAPHVFVEDISVRSIAAVKDEYQSGSLRDRMARYHADVDSTFYGWNDIWLSPAFRHWNVEEYVARVRAPILAMQGTGDEYGSLAQLDAIASKSPGHVDRLVLSGCKHAPHRDRRAMVEASASAWLYEVLGE